MAGKISYDMPPMYLWLFVLSWARSFAFQSQQADLKRSLKPYRPARRPESYQGDLQNNNFPGRCWWKGNLLTCVSNRRCLLSFSKSLIGRAERNLRNTLQISNPCRNRFTLWPTLFAPLLASHFLTWFKPIILATMLKILLFQFDKLRLTVKQYRLGNLTILKPSFEN